MKQWSAARLSNFRMSDGVQLGIHRLGDPDGAPIVMVPGTFSNSTFWLGTRGTGLARTLAGEGYDVWVVDPRGHGASDRPRKGDRWDFDDWARTDVPAILRAASERRRCALIGHSAGGAAILAGLAADPSLHARVSGAAILATPVPWLQGWRTIGSHAIRALSLALGRFPARRLGLGPEDELPHVMAQWMTWNIEGQWLGNDGTDYSAGLAKLDIPVLGMAGTGDTRFAPPDACRALFDMIRARDKTFQVCGRQTGFTEDFTHAGLVVSRAAQAEVWPRIVAWLGFLREAGTGCATGPLWRN